MVRRLCILNLFFLFLLNLNAENIDLNTARKVANEFSRKYIPQITISKQTFSDYSVNNNGELLYHIINLEPKGFIIVPAYDAAPPVIGYSLENNYSSEGQPENFTRWMEGYASVISSLIENKTASTPETTRQWQELLEPATTKSAAVVKTVGPLISCTWNQGSPYNIMCPVDPRGPGGHAYTGCVAAAMSQIMYYWRYPDRGKGSHGYTTYPYGYLFADFENTVYNWDEMTNSTKSSNFEMAKLQFHLGISVEMKYGGSTSEAYGSDAANALKTYFGYDQSLQLKLRKDYSDLAWTALLRNQIDAGYPLYYQGYGTGGHAFNVDGYQDNMLFHFNWGWGGSYNGYFHLSNLNPGGSSFTSEQGAIINFFPARSANVYQCKQNDTLTSITGSFEDGSGPVVNYFNNASCSWIIKPNDTLSHIELTFDRFDLIEGKDFIYVYDGTDKDSPIVASFTGKAIPPVIRSTSGSMFVQLVTDDNGTANGFQASYRAIPVPFCEAGNINNVTSVAGRISDGSGTFNYRNNSMCRYNLMPIGAKTIDITFNHFDTREKEDCLKIYDLDTQTLLYTFWGEKNPGILNFNTGKLYIVFETDNDSTAGGWDFSYTSTLFTDITDNHFTVQASVFPNPARNQIHVNISDIGNSCTIRLISSDGKVVYQENPAPTGRLERNIDVSAFRRGLYVLQVKSEKGNAHYKVLLN